MYQFSQLVGKEVYAAVDVPVKASAFDSAPIIRTIPKGGRIGEVFSWLNTAPGRSNIYLMFYGAFNIPFYIPYDTSGRQLDATTLKIQGTKTPEEILQEQEEASQTTLEKITKTGLIFVAAIGAVYVLGKYVSR